MNQETGDAANYITQYLRQGVPEQHLREHFTQHGWTNEHFDEALRIAQEQMTPPVPAPVIDTAAQVPFQPAVAQWQKSEQDTPATGQIPLNESQKYTIHQSLQDVVTAFERNTGTYFAALSLSTVVLVAGYIVAPLILKAAFTSGGRYSSALSIVGYLLFSTVWYAIASAFVMATTAQVLAVGKRGQAIKFGQLISSSFHLLPKVIVSSLVASTVMVGPAIVLGTLMVIATLLFPSPGIILLIGILAFPVSSIWLLIAALRLALVQQVALFEPQLSIRQILKRSSYLLQNGGQWFIFKGCLLLFAIYIVMSVITRSSVHELENSENVGVNVLFALIAVITVSSLTMLYLNRAAVRGHSS